MKQGTQGGDYLTTWRRQRCQEVLQMLDGDDNLGNWWKMLQKTENDRR